jgi:hypothetical protein
MPRMAQTGLIGAVTTSLRNMHTTVYTAAARTCVYVLRCFGEGTIWPVDKVLSHLPDPSVVETLCTR